MQTLLFYVVVACLAVLSFMLGFKAAPFTVRYKLKLGVIVEDIYLIYLRLIKANVPYRVIHVRRLNELKEKAKTKVSQDAYNRDNLGRFASQKEKERTEEDWQKVVYVDASGKIITIQDLKNTPYSKN